MTWEGWYTLAIITLVFIAMARNWGPTDAILFGGTLLVGLAGIISPQEVFKGFVNPGTVTIAALFIVAAAMRETGALDTVGEWMFGRATTERGGLLRMFGPVAVMSAFLNNTPIVAMLLPVVGDWCRKNRVSTSRMLMPLSFIAILGGTCTLIGTSTNLAINGAMVESRDEYPDLAEHLYSMGLFEMAWIGVPFVVIGGLYLLFASPYFLPDRQHLLERIESAPREYLADMQIQPGCKLIGLSVQEAGLRHLPGLFLTEIARDDHVIAPVGPDEVLQEDDILTFSGVVSTMVDLERIQGLVPVADDGYETRAAERRYKSLCEAVVSTRSPLVGKNVRDADFRARYNAAVIAVHRGGKHIRGRIGDIVLEPGDTLLLQTGPHFARAHRNNPDFYLVSDIAEARPVRHEKAVLCAVVLAILVVLMVATNLPVELVGFTAAGLMVGTRCISAGTARKSVDWQLLITIGSAFGLGYALENSGAATQIAHTIIQLSGDFGPHVVLLLLYAITGFFAALVSSKAAAVLMFPIALAAAIQMGVSPRPFIMAIAFAAAATFATPLGYPTNLIVYGPGGYRFFDFARLGLPLNVILIIIATVLIPIVWQF